MFSLTLILTSLFYLSCSLQFSSDIDVSTLSELPLERLLQVQRTFIDDDYKSDNLTNENVPQALPLQGTPRPSKRGGYHSYDDDYKKDKKEIQSIFQMSVTTLAFLAFGGYLLCLLCSAISNTNSTSNSNTNTQVVQAIIKQANFRRGTRRPVTNYRKRRPNRYRKKLRPRIKREIWVERVEPTVLTEKMYWALISLSEGYAGYHTVDYKHFNHTMH